MISCKQCRKCVLILLDGLGDRSYDSLDGRTPLQAARTPVLDRLAARGANGLYHAASVGQALPSETAHFAMFGYADEEFPGRGALEALGAGIPFESDDVAVLTHFAALAEQDNHLILSGGRVDADPEELAELKGALNELEGREVAIRFHPTAGVFGLLTLHGDVSPYFTDTDPIIAGRALPELKPWRSHQKDPATRNTVRALKDFLRSAYDRLSSHPVNRARAKADQPPVNGLVTQRAGRLKTVPFFRERYGLCGVSVASGAVYRGLCAYIGLDFREVADTDQPGADIADRLRAARELLARYDFIHVHTKTPDQAAHTKDPEAKRRVIEALDEGIGEAVDALADDPEVLLAVTADHSTPSAGPLVHSGEPVPLLFSGRGVRRDAVDRFDEVSAATGAMGLLRGRELIYLILSHLDRAKLRGLMDTPDDQAYWPGDYEPFRLR